MSDYVIEARKLKKVFYIDTEKVEALKGVDFFAEKGKIVGVMGPSGSGKTTLLHILGTIDVPTEGNVFIDKQDVLKLNERQLARFRNKKIGFVFQFHNLLPEFTALENVMLPAILYGKDKRKAKEKALNLLKQLGLEDRIHHKPPQLSGGQQQRVAIARAVINEPTVILADEPTGNLDSENSERVIQIFKELNQKKGITIVIATHDPQIANFCHMVYYMKDGKIVDIYT